ncbi:hypothetical protein QEH56_18965 [Pelagicoccus enzymogenes]|uniref:hypothetical protein n=1 Tax=Pelagicoccus enzymogenes TaxID=2773457 RepID=UPI00280EED41|nr:hypothetical protein [Pelagicoccus enzymogenes]MDQ8200252.1 hypothetical protein [Pelagicoccus enzymogenes]
MKATEGERGRPFSIEAPTGLEAQAMLRKFTGYEADEVWRAACMECGCETSEIGLPELERIASYLVNCGSLAAVVGQGLLIKIRIFQNAR